MIARSVVVYARKPGDFVSSIREGLARDGTERAIEVYQTLDDLAQRMKRPQTTESIAVLVLADRADLADMLSIHDLLIDHKIILILPDHEKDTVAKGHRLHPRFLTYKNCDFHALRSVLSNLLNSN